MSYGELTLSPVWTGINKQTGQFLKGHVPANKGKKWSDYMTKDERMKRATARDSRTSAISARRRPDRQDVAASR